MNNPAIEQALIELEDSLSKIESARTQVNKVAEKSELLIKAFNKVYDAITAVDKNITIDEKAIKTHLDESFKFFRAGLSDIILESEKSVKGLQTSLVAHETKITKLLNNTIDNTDVRLNDFVSKLTSNFAQKDRQFTDATIKILASINSINTDISIDKEAIAKQLNDNFKHFQTGLERIVKESDKSLGYLQTALAQYEKNVLESLKWTAESTEERLKEVLTAVKTHSEMTISFIDAEVKTFIGNTQKANDQMISFENNVKILENKIKEIDVRNELKSIEQKINSNQKQTLIIGIVIIVGLIAIAIFK